MIVIDAPRHIVPPVAVTVGRGFTVTTLDAVFVQPFPSVPVTTYVVVVVGLTIFEFPFPSPLFQVYVLAPLAVIVIDAPRHIVPPDNVIVGFGLTVTTLRAVAVTPGWSLMVTV